VYVPLLLTRPGQVGADTKTYLYLDPGRLLSRAAHMWDPNIGMGTVTHQNIGYLWPMGPYYWVMDAIGLPDWVAQRLWLGSILFLAGLGVRWMLRELRWEGAGLTVAAFAYALSPYVLEYAARISVILLPFAGLPWLIGLAARALRRRDWATPAAFALVTLTVGGVNATSLILVMFGPLLWFVYATFVEREVTLGQAIVVGLRITLLTAVTSLWWVAGLLVQGAFGIPILRYTETYETVAAAALAPEVLRGLGYWFFYGTDGLGAWTASTVRYVESVAAIALSYLLPGLAMVGAVLTRFRHRVFFAGIVLVGLVLSVGAHPWESPSPYGRLFRAWARGDLGLSFRSTPRAAPLVILGLAVFLGAGVAALARWRPRVATPVSGLLLVLICANQLPLFQGQMVDRNLVRDEQVPQYWLDAAAALDAGDRSTRVYEVPGIDFAAYRWGNTVDPITPGLTDREYVARELIPYGSPASAALLNAIEAPFQSGRPEPDVWAPMARLMGVGQIVLRGDTQFERYRTPRPRRTLAQLDRADGLQRGLIFGEAVPNEAEGPLRLDDEVELSTPATDPDPNPVMFFDVEDERPILRSVSASAPQVVAGDATGLVAMAAAGMLAPDRPLFFSASYAADPDALVELTEEPDSALVVTDTNRKQATRWGSVRDNEGYTERAGEEPLEEDLADNRLDVFPDAGDDQRTVAEQRGGATVAASAYGNNVTYTAGDRALKALDGDESTGWRVGAFDDPTGAYLVVTTDEQVTTDQVTLLQNPGDKNRWISDVTLTFDGGSPVSVRLDESSRVSPGQTVTFPERTFDTLRITIDRTDPPDAASFRGLSDVGFAEVVIPGVGPIDEVVRPPVDLLDTLGADSLERPLSYVFSRRGGNGVEPDRNPEEPTMRRWVEGPVQRSFTPYGLARLSRWLPDERVDELIGLAPASQGGLTATSSARLPGDPASRASAAVDGDPGTAYRTPVNGSVGQWVEYTYPEPVTVEQLTLEVVNDGKHSLPRQLSLSVDGGAPQQLTLPEVAVATDAARGATTELSAQVEPVTGTTFRIGIDAVTEAASTEWFGGSRIVLPVAIAEIGLPTVEVPAGDDPLPSSCRDDLVTIDGVGVPLRTQGSVAEALSGQSLELASCGDPVTVPPGRSLLESGDGEVTGLDVDLLALASAAGGGAGVDTLATPVDPGPPPPSTTTERTGRNDHRVQVRDATEPYWIVLGQSYSPGFEATTSDGTSLGEPTLINGYANGWRIDPAELGADVTVDISWTPQRLVWIGLALSALGVLACVALLLWPVLRRRRADARASTGVEPALTRPEPASPWLQDGPALGWSATAVVALVAGAGAALFGSPVLGLVVAVTAVVAARAPRGQVVPRVLSLGMFAAAAGYVLAKQLRNDYVVDFNWVGRFELAHGWALLAVFALVLCVVVDGLRGRRNEGD
jgi:arabinofuranan 3-O-arabinosyltransferase